MQRKQFKEEAKEALVRKARDMRPFFVTGAKMISDVGLR